MFYLTFRRAPHGSGTNLTRHDILDMEFEEIIAWGNLLEEALNKQAGGEPTE